LALLPDDRKLVSGGAKGSVCFWDAIPQSQTPSHTNLTLWPGFESIRGFERHAFEPKTLDPRVVQRLGLCFTPDSRSFITTEERTGSLVRWDVLSWRCVESLPAFGSNHWAVALSPDGHWLATGNFPNRVTLWDWTTRQAVTNFTVPCEFWGVLVFTHSGHYLIAWTLHHDYSTSARIWRTGDWVETPLTEPQLQGHWGIMLSPDDWLLAAGYPNGTVKLFRFPSLELEASLPNDNGAVAAILFSPDGRRLAVMTLDGSAQMWEVATRRRLASMKGLFNEAYGAAFSPDGQRLAAGGSGAGDAVKLWDLTANREVLSFQSKGKYFIGLTFSPDGNTLAATSLSGNAHLWHAPSWEEIEAAERKQREH
jgi:WD40 repeat protein